jgi:hypothetical protein
MADNKKTKIGFLAFLLVLSLIALFLFRDSLKPELVVFANDGPLGAISTKATQLPDSFLGFWMDIYLAGYEMPSAVPNLSVLLAMILKPLLFAKFYVPVTLLILGISAWVFFRQLGFNYYVAALGGLAAALNMNSFSNACWGQCSRALTQAAFFFALAALNSAVKGRAFLKCIIAGMAVGFGIMEGFDVGALYSLLFAAFAVFLAYLEEGNLSKGLFKGAWRVAVVAVCSALVAAHVLLTLITTQVIGVAGTDQDSRTKLERWYFATQWSLPKIETLRVIIPGLFGYRMVDAGSHLYEASYWGQVGRDPRRDLGMNVGYDRHSGSGEYAGVLVVLIAFWAIFESLRKKNSVFNDRDRKIIGFWSISALICLILAWGRHAPLYKLVYMLPFFSTIRNPIKFMHMFHMAIIILFGYGLAGMWKRYVEIAKPQGEWSLDVFKNWWKNTTGFDKKFTWAMILSIIVSILGAMVYTASKRDIENYLSKEGFPSDIAAQIANFSVGEVYLYLIFLVISAVAVWLFITGFFSGRKAKIGAIVLGAILVGDMCRANAPWIIYYDYKEKYATNPIIDFLREKPLDGRVSYDIRIAGLNLMNMAGVNLPPQIQQLEQTFAMLYYQEWLQHHFLYYNIQTANYAQMPRMPKDYEAMLKTFSTLQSIPRYWQLMNTKYLVGLASFAEILNNHLDPVQKRFKVLIPFDLEPKPGVERATRLEELTASPKTNGLFALIEWKAALPRAALYTHWITITNEQEILQKLSDPQFDPWQSVIVSSNIPAPTVKEPTMAVQVGIKHYEPKDIKIEVDVKTPSVLLLNDRYAPDWKVWIDGKPGQLFKANYLMRGVYLEPGKHEVEYKFQPSPLSLFISLASIGLCCLVGCYLLITKRRED